MTKQKIYQNIISLLNNRKWKKQETKAKFDIYYPPTILNFDNTYKLYVYNKFENNDFDIGIKKNLEILAQIYNEDIDELASIVIEDRQILSLHIENENIKDARPTIPFFDTLIHKSKELLQEAANFSVIQKAHFFDSMDEAERYLNYCNFFKNDVGSLITKIQLPNKEEIKEKTLFEKAITGQEINNNLFNITNFINEEILGCNNFEPSDEFLIDNKDIISVNVSNKLKDLYAGMEYSDIEISLKSIESNKKTIAKELNREKVNNLSTFSKTVREKMKEISENNIYGKITQLKSKDVDSDKNMIIIEGEVKKVKSKISIQLNSDQIKSAADAFKNNRTVIINGILEKEKSQYKVVDLKEFRPIIKGI